MVAELVHAAQTNPEPLAACTTAQNPKHLEVPDQPLQPLLGALRHGRSKVPLLPPLVVVKN